MQISQNRDSRCISVNIMKLLRTLFLQKNLREIASAFLFAFLSTFLFSIDCRFQYIEMLFCLLRSRHWKCSVKVKEGVLENFLMFTLQKTIVLESLFNKVADLKKRLQHRCFPMDTAKILWTPILKKICKQLILFLIYWVITAICFWKHIFS